MGEKRERNCKQKKGVRNGKKKKKKACCQALEIVIHGDHLS